MSGKLKQNTIKATVVSDAYGSTLFPGGRRPGQMHDTTAARVEGIDALLHAYPQVKMLVDAGYQGNAEADVFAGAGVVGAVVAAQ